MVEEVRVMRFSRKVKGSYDLAGHGSISYLLKSGPSRSNIMILLLRCSQIMTDYILTGICCLYNIRRVSGVILTRVTQTRSSRSPGRLTLGVTLADVVG